MRATITEQAGGGALPAHGGGHSMAALSPSEFGPHGAEPARLSGGAQ